MHYEWFLKYPLDKQRSKSGVPQVWAYDVCLKVPLRMIKGVGLYHVRHYHNPWLFMIIESSFKA